MSEKKPRRPTGSKTTGQVARSIQRTQDARDKRAAESSSDTKSRAAVQAGVRRYPVTLSKQHQSKTGNESRLKLQPQFMAPDYVGSGKLEGFSTIVTGGDSGIGRAVAVLFAREGADVTIVYLESHDDAAETKRCIEAEGGRCLLVPGDVKNPKFCVRVVEKTVKAFGRLDVLVNNAAFQEHAADIAEISEERFDLTFRTNIGGYFHMAKAALPHMTRGASIINTGSVTGLEGSPTLFDYSATKGAIHAFTKALAQNVLDQGIRVNAIAPGPVWTPLNPADSPSKKVAKFGRDTKMKRAAQPEELSPAYVFLASPICSSYISGIVLPVTGSIGAI